MSVQYMLLKLSHRIASLPRVFYNFRVPKPTAVVTRR